MRDITSFRNSTLGSAKRHCFEVCASGPFPITSSASNTTARNTSRDSRSTTFLLGPYACAVLERFPTVYSPFLFSFSFSLMGWNGSFNCVCSGRPIACTEEYANFSSRSCLVCMRGVRAWVLFRLWFTVSTEGRDGFCARTDVPLYSRLFHASCTRLVTFRIQLTHLSRRGDLLLVMFR